MRKRRQNLASSTTDGVTLAALVQPSWPNEVLTATKGLAMEHSVQPPPLSGPTDFQKLMRNWAEAIVENDANKIRRFTTDDWQLVDTNGIITLDRFLEVVTSGELEHDEMTHDVRSVQHIDDVALVITHGKNQGRWQGESFSADEWTTQIFVWQDDQWLCHMTALTPRQASTT